VAARDHNGDEQPSRLGYIAAILISALGHAAIFALFFFVAPMYLKAPEAAPPAYTVKIVDDIPAGDLGTHLPRINRNHKEPKDESKPPEVKTEDFDRADWLRDWAQELHQRLNGLDDGTRTYRVEVSHASEGHAARVLIHKTEHGTPSNKYLPREFFESAEYQRIADLARTLAGLISEGAYVTRGEDRYEVGSFKEAMKWLFDQARRGQTLQRYKGLGEMNPEQLWDTTINPESRRLLQVKIDDAVAADDIFTTLMGDQVEPRREFIEKNALSVMNLDV